jgi:hypothetical protein
MRERRDHAPAMLSQAGAPLSWTSERADTFFVCEQVEGSGTQAPASASGAALRRERAVAFPPLRATTKQADRKRAMRAQQGQTKLSGWPMLLSAYAAAIPSLGCPVRC